VGLEKFAGPDGWNDPDMLEVGNRNLTENESRAHFSLWCMLAAPLMAGNDLRNMTETTRQILTNPAAIAIDQDPLGRQGWRLQKNGPYEVWVKPLANNEWAVCFFNRSRRPYTFHFAWQDLPGFAGKYDLYDCWQHATVGDTEVPLSTPVPARDVVLLRLKKN
jgi:alpha-galactosidase